MSSIKNIVTVAILQVGVIVFGVLAAGIVHKEWSTYDMVMPLPVAILYTYGFVAFLVPLVWSTCAVTLQLRANVSDDLRILIFWFGILLLIGLAVFCVYADVAPWLTGNWNLPGNGDDPGP
jgi:hypothetical protein